MKVAIAAFLAVALLGAAICGSYWLGLHALRSSQQNWCATLTLLTARPVPSPSDPAANPSRENAYRFYTNLVNLRDRFGC